jgi:mycofactocin precursor
MTPPTVDAVPADAPAVAEPTLAASPPPAPGAAAAAAPLLEEDLLVEDVSIDGMCGVY